FLASFSVLAVICRPPCSSLFPYTTLFRSLDIVMLHEQRVEFLHRFRFPPGFSQQLRRMALHGQVGRMIGRNVAELKDRFLKPPVDRKSTRLNSSHVKTSYAVFCLKKTKSR